MIGCCTIELRTSARRAVDFGVWLQSRHVRCVRRITSISLTPRHRALIRGGMDSSSFHRERVHRNDARPPIVHAIDSVVDASRHVASRRVTSSCRSTSHPTSICLPARVCPSRCVSEYPAAICGFQRTYVCTSTLCIGTNTHTHTHAGTYAYRYVGVTGRAS